MNSRKEGKLNFEKRQDVLEILRKDDFVVSYYPEKETSVYYEVEITPSKGRCSDFYSRTLYFQKKETVNSLRERILMDEPVKKILDEEKLSVFLYENVDVNSLMALERMAFTWDDPMEEDSASRTQLWDEFSDEYAMECGLGNLGITWVERQVVFINVRDLYLSSKEIHENIDPLRSIQDIFEEGLLQTIFHECRHLLYECNEFVKIGRGSPYPANGGLECHVEEYGNEEAERILRDGKFQNFFLNDFWKELESGDPVEEKE